MDRDRYVAYKALLAIEEEGAWSNLAVARVLAEDGGRVSSPSFIRELVYGVTENKLYLDYVLDKMAKKGISGTDPRTLVILRMGIFQIEFMESVPDHAAVSTSVALARKCAAGRERFVNGMLRNYLRERGGISLPDREGDPAGYLSVRWSCHRSLAEFLIKTFGPDDAEEFLRFANSRKVTGIRADLSRISLEEAEDALGKCGIAAEKSRISERMLLTSGGGVTETDLFKNGLISIQSEGSCMIADIAGARPGEKVMDMCAAPGGKTVAMAESMKGEGVIYAFDLYPHRVGLIAQNAGRAGIRNIITECRDASCPMEEHMGTADLVLLDVPCSGLGVIREKPEIKLKAFDPAVPGLAEIQEKILETCSGYVKPGGRLLYSTCTVNPAENGGRTGDFLRRHPEFSIRYEKTLLPQTDGTDGFYAALMVRE